MEEYQQKGNPTMVHNTDLHVLKLGLGQLIFTEDLLCELHSARHLM